MSTVLCVEPRPNGVESTYAYDTAGRVTSIKHTKGASTLLSFAYTHDDAGRRTSVTTPEGTESYSYDALGRLTQVSYPGGPTVSYTYDAAGNRTTETRGGSTTNYDYDAAGQLVTVGNKTYTHDANGNLTQAGSDSFAWDYDNRLTQATVGTHTASYTYDGDGVRVGATVDGAARSFLLDGEDGLSKVVDDGSKAYLHADGPLAEVGSTTATQLLGDALGSVRGLANDGGSLVGTSTYEAFGALRTTSGATSLFGFTGEPVVSTGLVYLRARSLDPATGQMLSADTVVPNAPGTQGYNLYSYVANNPVRWVDPSGHQATIAVPWQGMSSAALAALAAQVYTTLTVALADQTTLAVTVLAFWAMALILTCLLDVSCKEAFVAAVGAIADLGSDIAVGVIDWTIDLLFGAPREFPIVPAAAVPVAVEGVQEAAIERRGTTALVMRPVVIGENSTLRPNRVAEAAIAIGAEWHIPPYKTEDRAEQIAMNQIWLVQVMMQRRTIYDLGIAPERTDRSVFYAAERRLVTSYPFLFPYPLPEHY